MNIKNDFEYSVKNPKKFKLINKATAVIVVSLLSIFCAAGCTEEDIKQQLQSEFADAFISESASSNKTNSSKASNSAASSDSEKSSSNSETDTVNSEASDPSQDDDETSGGSDNFYSDYQASDTIQSNFTDFYNTVQSQASDNNASAEFVPIEDTGFSEGNGTQSRPYVITSAEELELLSERVNSGQMNSGVYFALGANIDMSGVNFAPIGNSTHRFSSFFDGRGYTVSNLSPKLIYEDFGNNANYSCGFFGIVDNAEIKNLCLENVNITYTYKSNYFSEIGALAACVYPTRKCKITDCKVSGSINVEADTLLAGGIVGDIFVTVDAELIFERLQSDVKIQVRSDSVNVGAVSGSILGRGTESFSDICASSEILHSTQYRGAVGAFGGVANSQGSISVSNCFFNINTNTNYDDKIHPLIGEIIDSYEPRGSFNFLNVFAFADGCSELYEIPSENPVKAENCACVKELPPDCNFNTEIWDINDPAAPFIKTLSKAE